MRRATSTTIMDEPLVMALATRQLAAYNAADLKAFVDCFHPEVVVLNADGSVAHRGKKAFRATYATMFATYTEVHAEVTKRMVLGEHLIEKESWSRVHGETGEKLAGEVLVRWSELGGLLRWVQFLRPASTLVA